MTNAEIEERALARYPEKRRMNDKGTGTFDANLPRRKAFIDGMRIAREEMLKGAEKTIVYYDRFRDQEVVSHWFGWYDGFKAGDKVRLIVVKEDEAGR